MFLTPFKVFDLVAFPIELQVVEHMIPISVPPAKVLPGDLAISTASEHLSSEAFPSVQNDAKRKFMTYQTWTIITASIINPNNAHLSVPEECEAELLKFPRQAAFVLV